MGTLFYTYVYVCTCVYFMYLTDLYIMCLLLYILYSGYYGYIDTWWLQFKLVSTRKTRFSFCLCHLLPPSVRS